MTSTQHALLKRACGSLLAVPKPPHAEALVAVFPLLSNLWGKKKQYDIWVTKMRTNTEDPWQKASGCQMGEQKNGRKGWKALTVRPCGLSV
jgi:hypothetical protein